MNQGFPLTGSDWVPMPPNLPTSTPSTATQQCFFCWSLPSRGHQPTSARSACLIRNQGPVSQDWPVICDHSGFAWHGHFASFYSLPPFCEATYLRQSTPLCCPSASALHGRFATIVCAVSRHGKVTGGVGASEPMSRRDGEPSHRGRALLAKHT